MSSEAQKDRLGTEQIESLAHALWEARGRPDGSPEQDWYEAERQLASRIAQVAPSGRTPVADADNVPAPEIAPFRLRAVLRGCLAGIRHFSSHGGVLPVCLILLAISPLIRFRSRRER
jgi:hypothetical protein